MDNDYTVRRIALHIDDRNVRTRSVVRNLTLSLVASVVQRSPVDGKNLDRLFIH